LFGSQSLELDNCDDTDIAIMLSDLPEELKHLQVFSPENYFTVLPFGCIGFIRITDQIKDFYEKPNHIDILLFNNKLGLSVISGVVRDLKSIPKFYVTEKKVRIKLYEIGITYYNKMVENI